MAAKRLLCSFGNSCTGIRSRKGLLSHTLQKFNDKAAEFWQFWGGAPLLAVRAAAFLSYRGSRERSLRPIGASADLHRNCRRANRARFSRADLVGFPRSH